MSFKRLAQYTGETRVTSDHTTLFGGGYTPDSDQKYTGNYSYYQWWNAPPFGHSVVPGVSSMRFGFWLRVDAVEKSNTFLFLVIANTTGTGTADEHLRIRLDIPTSTMILERPLDGSTRETLATATLPNQYNVTGQWCHIGFSIKLDATNGFISMYVDGERVLNYIGDTRISRFVNGVGQVFSNTAIYWLGHGANGQSGAQGWRELYIDDMYFDQMIDEEDAPVPARRFLMVLPTENGVDTEWTPSTGTNYQNVDENPNNGGTDYNKAVDPNLRDTFVMGDIVLPADHRIVAAIPSPFVRKLDTEIDSKLSLHAYDGTDYLDSEDLSLTMSYNRPVFARLTEMPNGQDWTEAGFNAMQFGYQSRGEL